MARPFGGFLHGGGIGAGGTAVGQIMINPYGVEASAKLINSALTSIGAYASQLAKTISKLRLTIVGIAAFLVFRKAITTLARFSDEMAKVQAITEASAGEFALLKKRATDLGATTRFEATQVAEAMTFLARAGFNVKEVLDTTESTLKLAQVGALDLGRAADIASNILTAFKLRADELGGVVDILAKTSNSANTNVNQLGEAMAYVGAVAEGSHASLAETAAAIGTLGDAGIQGTVAGTGLRRLLVTLAKLTAGGGPEKVRKILKLLEVDLTKLDVRIYGIRGALLELQRAGITVAEAFEIFRDRGGTVAQVLLVNTQRFAELHKLNLDATNSATKMADIMDRSLLGTLKKVASAAQAVTLAFGDVGFYTVANSGLLSIAGGLRKVAANLETIVSIVETFLIAGGFVFIARQFSRLASTTTLAVNRLRNKLKRDAQFIDDTNKRERAAFRQKQDDLQKAYRNEERLTDDLRKAQERARAQPLPTYIGSATLRLQRDEVNKITAAYNTQLAATRAAHREIQNFKPPPLLDDFTKSLLKASSAALTLLLPFNAIFTFAKNLVRRFPGGILGFIIGTTSAALFAFKEQIKFDVGETYVTLGDVIEHTSSRIGRTVASGFSAAADATVKLADTISVEAPTIASFFKGFLIRGPALLWDYIKGLARDALDLEELEQQHRERNLLLSVVLDDYRAVRRAVSQLDPGQIKAFGDLIDFKADIDEVTKATIEFEDSLSRIDRARATGLFETFGGRKTFRKYFGFDADPESIDRALRIKAARKHRDRTTAVEDILLQNAKIQKIEDDGRLTIFGGLADTSRALGKIGGAGPEAVLERQQRRELAISKATNKEKYKQQLQFNDARDRIFKNWVQRQPDLYTQELSGLIPLSALINFDTEGIFSKMREIMLGEGGHKGIQEFFKLQKIHTDEWFGGPIPSGGTTALREFESLYNKIYASVTSDPDNANATRIQIQQKVLDLLTSELFQNQRITEEYEKQDKLVARSYETRREIDPKATVADSGFAEEIHRMEHRLALTKAITQEEKRSLAIDERIRQLKKQYGKEEVAQVEAHIRAILERQAVLERSPFQRYREELADTQTQIENTLVSGIKAASDAMADFILFGKSGFADLGEAARNLARAIASTLIQQLIVDRAAGFIISSLGLGGAGAGAGAAATSAGASAIPSGLTAVAQGGVLDSPTFFNASGRFGVAGEAGPEAVMPLKRNRRGDLGVSVDGMVGGGNISVPITQNFNIGGDLDEKAAQEASRATVEGVREIIISELYNQKRSGGILK